MSKRSKKILLISLAIGLFVFVAVEINKSTFLEVAVRKYPTLNPVEAQLRADLSDMISQYENEKIPVIDISLLTTFTWDRLYVFGPYTDLSKLDLIFGKSWRGNCYTYIDSSDGIALLVFTEKSRVVHCIQYPRGKNDFADLQKYESGFSFEDTLFVLDEKGRVVWMGDK